MARTARAARITTPSHRKKLPPRDAPWWRPIHPGLRVGYRRTSAGVTASGSWLVRLARPGGRIAQKALGLADDRETADGRTILSFAQAVETAIAWVRSSGRDTKLVAEQPVTVREALTRYRSDKINAGQDARAGEVTTLLGRHVPAQLADIQIASLTEAQLRAWVGGLRGKGDRRLTQHRIDGLRGVLGAALRSAKAPVDLLRNGLSADTTAAATGGPRAAPAARRAILTSEEIAALLAAAEEIDPDLARFLLVLDLTGARPSQVARLVMEDVDLERAVLLIPRSAKGRPGMRKSDAIPFPLPAHFLRKLHNGADPTTRLLLHRPMRRQEPGAVGVWRVVGRAPWSKNTWTRPFREIVVAAAIGRKISIYALRHSRLAALLLAGVPAQAVAAVTDTSVAMLAQHYARYIADHDPTQQMIRRALGQAIPI
jgi:integrase